MSTLGGTERTVMKDERQTADLPLATYRVLDLTEGGFNRFGRVLADLDADVIKVEPPGGSPTRMRRPFSQDRADPEDSLFWYSYCPNKRGVTLDLERAKGRRHLKELAAGSDIGRGAGRPVPRDVQPHMEPGDAFL